MRETIKIRISLKDLNRAKHLAAMYADGDLSKWIRHGMMNAPRRYLK